MYWFDWSIERFRWTTTTNWHTRISWCLIRSCLYDTATIDRFDIGKSCDVRRSNRFVLRLESTVTVDISAADNDDQQSKRRCIELCIGSEQLISSILSNIEMAMKRSHSNDTSTKLLCIVDSSKAMSMKKWATDELHKQSVSETYRMFSILIDRYSSCAIFAYLLAKCARIDRSIIVSQTEYLYYRTMTNGGWTMQSGADWRYFVLKVCTFCSLFKQNVCIPLQRSETLSI